MCKPVETNWRGNRVLQPNFYNWLQYDLQSNQNSLEPFFGGMVIRKIPMNSQGNKKIPCEPQKNSKLHLQPQNSRKHAVLTRSFQNAKLRLKIMVKFQN